VFSVGSAWILYKEDTSRAAASCQLVVSSSVQLSEVK
jgi:hypothetical protein